MFRADVGFLSHPVMTFHVSDMIMEGSERYYEAMQHFGALPSDVEPEARSLYMWPLRNRFIAVYVKTFYGRTVSNTKILTTLRQYDGYFEVEADTVLHCAQLGVNVSKGMLSGVNRATERCVSDIATGRSVVRELVVATVKPDGLLTSEPVRKPSIDIRGDVPFTLALEGDRLSNMKIRLISEWKFSRKATLVDLSTKARTSGRRVEFVKTGSKHGKIVGICKLPAYVGSQVCKSSGEVYSSPFTDTPLP
ncbi:hypothetical protein MD484_g285, partial [Candolleomyces efflorescens]